MTFLPALLALISPAQDASSLLTEVKKAYSQVTTARFKVKFDTTDPHMRKLTGTAEVWFLRPHSVKVVLSGLTGGTQTVVSNGRRITIRTKSSHKSGKFSLDTLSHVLPLNVETFAFLDWSRELSTEKGGAMAGSDLSIKKTDWNGRSWNVLEELNRADDSLDRYFIGGDDHLIWRVQDMSADGKTVFSDTQMSGPTLGEPIPESVFESS